MKQKNQWVESRSAAWKDAGARTLEGVNSRERETGKDHERKRVVAPREVPHETKIFIEDLADSETSGTSETSASATSSTSETSESGRRRRRTPTPTASPTPTPTRSPSEVSATSEMSVSSVGRWTRNFLRDEAVVCTAD